MEGILKVAHWIEGQAACSAGPGIVFVRTKARARALAETVSKLLGRPVPHVTSEVGQKTREQYLARLRSGSLPVVVATSALSTGVDIPELRWVAFADRGKAPIWVIQSAGRGSRPAPGKTGFDVFDLIVDEAATRRDHLKGYCDDPEDVVELCRQRPRRSNGGKIKEETRQAAGAARPYIIGWFWTLAIAFALYAMCILGQ